MKWSPSSLRAAAIAALISVFPVACAPAVKAPPARCATSGIQRVGGPISLVDQTGRAVTEADFADRPTVLYFGFANCPDICPTSLQTLRAAFDARSGGAPDVNVALVTLDPERDTTEILARYVSSDAFPKGLKGLTGTPAQIDAAAAAFKVLHQKREEQGSAVGYVIDHSSLFYVMDRAWKPIAIFPSEMTPADMSACLDAAMAGAKG
ncbi:MAG: SCO family protein [Alphaproteobacteria bacterium]|nr:SCO family protein [Alphaproteobacteria bacterium]